MREECKHFESRTYSDGETVRRCKLDLAPEAPWRCPDDCPRHGKLVVSPTPPEPASLEGVAELLDEAEDIVNAIGPEIVAEMDREQRRQPFWKRFRRK